jgi:LmbE family N-acetylglucosaminyl deacetylase
MESIILRETEGPRRLLLALAHPDDESFGPAGTIIHYARQGVAVHDVCGTRGEAGKVDPGLLVGYRSLADLRTGELLCAARHLGLAGLHFLDYHDSGMEETAIIGKDPLDEILAQRQVVEPALLFQGQEGKPVHDFAGEHAGAVALRHSVFIIHFHTK